MNSKYIKSVITLVPAITLTVITCSTVYYNLFNDEYLLIYSLMSNMFGYGLFWLPVYYYVAYKYHLCAYTCASLYGLTFYNVINLSYDIARLLQTPLDSNSYMKMFESVGLMLFLAFVFIKIIIQIRNGDRN